MSSITEQIKEKIDIVDFLKQYINLQPAGKNFRALCPFHKETNPSFIVSPDRQSWYCFGGCNEGGDIFKFLMKYENIEFYEALKILADKAGINLKESSAGLNDYKQYGVLYEINEAAKNYFKNVLWSVKQNNPILNYLFHRGLKEETIKEFELGVAPDKWDALTLELIHLGFDVKDIERAGLAFKNQRGTYQDRFRGRLMFPIFTHFGKIAGFTGRALRKDEDAKYINVPETPVFNKSRILYGLHKSKTSIREKGEAVLVEGQMDFLMAYQDGVKNVVATSGTALTADHLKTLRRLADKLVLSFDSDEAGQLAAERSIELAGAHDFSVKVLTFNEKDPADIAKTQPGELAKLINNAQPAMDFFFQRYWKGVEDAAAQKAGIRQILMKIKSIYSDIEKSIWLRRLSELTAVPESDLREEMAKLKTNNLESLKKENGSENQNQVNFSKKEIIAARIFDLSGELVIPNWRPSELLAMKAGFLNSQISSPEKELTLLRSQFKLEELKEKRRLVRKKIQEAEQKKDEEALRSALKEFDEINKTFYSIKNYGD